MTSPTEAAPRPESAEEFDWRTVAASHVVLAAWLLLPLIAPVPTHLNILVTATLTVASGSLRSIKPSSPAETMSSKVCRSGCIYIERERERKPPHRNFVLPLSDAGRCQISFDGERCTLFPLSRIQISAQGYAEHSPHPLLHSHRPLCVLFDRGSGAV